jgi:hypothetical protein
MVANEAESVPDPNAFTDASPAPANDKELAVLCDSLSEIGITQVVVLYEGCADSGGVEKVEYQPPDAQVPQAVDDKLRDLAEGYCPDGYENNDGGYGTLTVYPSLGLAKLDHTYHYEDSEAIDIEPAPLPPDLKHLLLQIGVARITVSVDGYGDSGQIETITTDPEGIEIGRDLWSRLEDFLLDLLPGGWENNEGGFGDFVADVQTGQVEVDAYWRVQQDSDAEITRWKWRK